MFCFHLWHSIAAPKSEGVEQQMPSHEQDLDASDDVKPGEEADVAGDDTHQHDDVINRRLFDNFQIYGSVIQMKVREMRDVYFAKGGRVVQICRHVEF